MHEIWMFSTTIAAIIAGVLFNRSDYHRLDTRIESMNAQINMRFEQMNAQINMRFDGLQRDMNHFYQTLGSHDARIETVEKRQQS